MGVREVGHNAAYKFLNVSPMESRLEVTAIRNADEAAWFGFRTRTQLFGSAASVLHYNSFPRIVSTLLTRARRLPVMRYFADFGPLSLI